MGPKQVFREEKDNRLLRDTIALRDESLPGTPLLKAVMYGGKSIGPPEPITAGGIRSKNSPLTMQESPNIRS